MVNEGSAARELQRCSDEIGYFDGATWNRQEAN